MFFFLSCAAGGNASSKMPGFQFSSHALIIRILQTKVDFGDVFAVNLTVLTRTLLPVTEYL